MQVQPGGFAVSKKYYLDVSTRQIINKKNNNRLSYDIDSKILVYEDRQKTWFFNIAKKLKKDNEAGFVILMIASSYLESNQQYRTGSSSRNNSTLYIKTALKRIFPTITQREENIFVDGVRCGLFHDGITKKGVFINASQDNIFVSNAQSGTLIVNPHKFLDSVRSDFDDYIKLLKRKRERDEDARTNFESMWDSQKGI